MYINIIRCYWLHYYNLIWGGCNMIKDYSTGANTSITITNGKILIPNIRTNKKLNILLNVIKNMKGKYDRSNTTRNTICTNKE